MAPFGGDADEMEAALAARRLREAAAAAAARGWDPLRSGSAPPTMEGARAAVEGLRGGGGSLFSGSDGLGARLDEVNRRRGDLAQDHFGNSALPSAGLPSVQFNGLGDVNGQQFGLTRVHSFGSAPNLSTSTLDSHWAKSKTNDLEFHTHLQSHFLANLGRRNSTLDSRDLDAISLSDHGDISDALSGLKLSSGTATDGRSQEQELLDEILKYQSELSCKMPNGQRRHWAGNVFGIPNSERLDIHSLPIPGDSGLSKWNSVIDGFDSKVNPHSLKSGEHMFPTFTDQLTAMHFDNMLGDTDYFQSASMTKMTNPLRSKYSSTADLDFARYQKAYLEALVAQQYVQHDKRLQQKSGLSNYDNRLYLDDLHFPYSRMQRSGSYFPSNLGSLPSHSDRQSQLLSLGRSATGRYMESSGYQDTPLASYFETSFLEKVKRNGSGTLELVDIVDRVMEFGMDQYGSRFIQQKLETASADEKEKIFPEILSNAIALTTDVFGNYVIQKFFEFGTESQISQLADQLKGHILELSFQMYGCRVVQKVLEVVDMDRKINIVQELDSAVLKCIADQNGNHVVQKSIECVPEDHIQFVMTAILGQIVVLCTHQYGCRVIQRVLEHCHDPTTQSTVMDEIMQHVCSLAQDKFGNYVVQHVLQNGKQEERSAIIQKLSGQVVQMSQQKFASNVVEKCLAFGATEERDDLIREIVGSGDNETFQELMKDQFGNYVVQKVLQTCDDKNLEMILSGIKVHLNELKNYTYGKHIVSRVEKLIVTGERRARMMSKSYECRQP